MQRVFFKIVTTTDTSKAFYIIAFTVFNPLLAFISIEIYIFNLVRFPTIIKCLMKIFILYCNLSNQIIFLDDAPLMCQAVLAVCTKTPQGQLIGVGPPCGLQKTRRVFWHLVWTRKEYPIESAFGCYSKQRHVKMILTH